MSKSNIFERLEKLLYKAGHPNTPRDEAIACSLKAAKQFYEWKNNNTEQMFSNEVSEADNIWHDEVIRANNPNAEWIDISTFRTVISKKVGICKSCNKSYNKGEIVAEAYGQGITHHRCRRYWVDKGYNAKHG